MGCEVHVPIPVAAMVADPPTTAISTGPASGFAMTVSYTVSAPLPVVHTKPYMPTTVIYPLGAPVINVVGEEGFTINVLCGFDARADQVPVPVAAMVKV